MSELTSKEKVSGEPPGTIFVGSIDKRCYLFLCQSSARMQVERENARQHGIQDPIDFIFEIDGTRYELTYQQLRALLGQFVEMDSLRRHIADLERRLNVKLAKSTAHEPLADQQAAERAASIAISAAGKHAERVVELEAEVSTLRESLAEVNRLLSLNVAEVERLRSTQPPPVAPKLCTKCGGHQSTHNDTRACKHCGGTGAEPASRSTKRGDADVPG